MEMEIEVRDTVTPDIQRRIRRLRDPRSVLLAMGEAVVSLAKRAFADPGLRPAAWPARKKEARHSILRRTGDLWKGIHVEPPSSDSVRVGSPKPYALVHQYGSRKQGGRGSGIPARPFFPFHGSPQSAQLTRRAETAVLEAARRQLADALENQ